MLPVIAWTSIQIHVSSERGEVVRKKYTCVYLVSFLHSVHTCSCRSFDARECLKTHRRLPKCFVRPTGNLTEILCCSYREFKMSPCCFIIFVRSKTWGVRWSSPDCQVVISRASGGLHVVHKCSSSQSSHRHFQVIEINFPPSLVNWKKVHFFEVIPKRAVWSLLNFSMVLNGRNSHVPLFQPITTGLVFSHFWHWIYFFSGAFPTLTSFHCPYWFKNFFSQQCLTLLELWS